MISLRLKTLATNTLLKQRVRDLNIISVKILIDGLDMHIYNLIHDFNG